MTTTTSRPIQSLPYLTRSAPVISMRRRVFTNRMFVIECIAATSVSIVILLILLTAILTQGIEYLGLDFLRNSPSRKPGRAGIHPSLFGSIWVCVTCALFALPIGVGTAVLLEEFQPKHPFIRRLHQFIQLNITNLAGVPSIVYGIIGLTAFVQAFGLMGGPLNPLLTVGTHENWYYFQLPFGRGVLAGALTLMLVILPIVIISSQEALRAVPDSLREASLAMGATKLQTIGRITLPAATPGMMTGAILAMSRAIGEAAPILIIAGIVYITFTPIHLMDDFTAMPLQIYDWASRPQEDFHKVAASGILVLLGVLLSFNAAAVIIRQKFQRPLQ